MSDYLGSQSQADYWNLNAHQLYATKATAGASGNLSNLTISLHADPGVSTIVGLGVYSDDGGSPSKPANRLLDAGTVDVNGGGEKTISSLTLAITNGTTYWIAARGDGTTAAQTHSDTTSTGTNYYQDWQEAYDTYGFPATFPASPSASGAYKWTFYGEIVASGATNVVRMLI